MSTSTTMPVRAGRADPVIYTMTTIRPSLLTVDHSVQRAEDGVRVATIAGDFEPGSLGVIHVSKRPDGIYHIIDGQHRVAALRVLGKGDVPIPCQIYEGLSRAEEAAMFRRLNNTRQVQILDRFRVRIVEGDPVACDIAELLKAQGWTITKAGARGSFFAVAAMEKVYRAKEGGDPDTCAAVVRIATEAWGHDSNALRAEIVSGLGVLLRRHPGLEMTKLITEMGRHEGGPLGLIGQARQLHSIRSGRISDAMAEILVNRYNSRRKINRIPEWNAA
jgi:hypothetical protein